jgi:S1-C subfamily serine protease
MRVGSQVKLTLLRDGKTQTVEVKIGEAPSESASAGEPSADTVTQKLQGATLKDNGSGVTVAQVEQGSPAWRSGLRPGDEIVGVNRKRVHSVKEFKAVAGESPAVLALNVKRGDANLFVVVR